MKYTAGWNMAGYLPETDPVTFDTLQEAATYLKDTVERWQDEDWQESDVDSLTADDIITVSDNGADGWYRDIHLWAQPAQDAWCCEAHASNTATTIRCKNGG